MEPRYYDHPRDWARDPSSEMTLILNMGTEASWELGKLLRCMLFIGDNVVVTSLTVVYHSVVLSVSAVSLSEGSEGTGDERQNQHKQKKKRSLRSKKKKQTLQTSLVASPPWSDSDLLTLPTGQSLFCEQLLLGCFLVIRRCILVVSPPIVQTSCKQAVVHVVVF